MPNSPRDAALLSAIHAGDIIALQQALTNNADPDASDAQGRSALYLAASAGELGMMAILISRGADVNKTEDGGFAPLHEAISRKHFSAADLLLEKGANINLQDGDLRLTPLHVALNVDLREERTDRVMYLLQKGADETLKNAQARDVLELCDTQYKRFPFAGEIATYIEEFVKTRGLKAQAAEKERLQSFNQAAQDGLARDVTVRRITIKPRAPAR